MNGFHNYLFLFILICLTNFIQCYLPLVILHTNSIRSRFSQIRPTGEYCRQQDEDQCIGGFPRLVHVVKAHRNASEHKEIPPVLYFNTGNVFSGTIWFATYSVAICSSFMKMIRPDAMSIGSHDFVQGILPLTSHIATVNRPTVASNAEGKHIEKTNIRKSAIIDVDGVKIGIVGYIRQRINGTEFTGHLKFSDEIEALQRETRKLYQQGVKIIIALGNADYTLDKEIAEKVTLVDIVIGGGIDTLLYNGSAPGYDDIKPADIYPKMIEQISGKKVPVVTTLGFTKYIGRLNVTFDSMGDLIECQGQPIYLSHDIPQDPITMRLLKSYAKGVEKLSKKLVGKSKVMLNSAMSICSKTECNIGNLITDAFIDYAATNYSSDSWSYIPISFINSGSIGASIIVVNGSGDITYGDVYQTLPYQNNLLRFSLNGSDLIEAIKYGMERSETNALGQFLQVSGLKLQFTMNPATKKYALISAQARCGACPVPVYDEIERTNVYNIVSTEYLMDGGDGYAMLKERAFNVGHFKMHEIDVLSTYITKMSPIISELEERIVVVAAGGPVSYEARVISVLLGLLSAMMHTIL